MRRLAIPDGCVPWTSDFPTSQDGTASGVDAYKPPFYIAAVVAAGPVWADNWRERKTFQFNSVDGRVNRTSFEGHYTVDPHGSPLNPRGRTGLAGMGLLGRVGPNHAADPIVTRWQRTPDGALVLGEDDQPVLEVVLIKRRDTGEWAIPGGMVEAGDTVGRTLSKEFGEEALASLERGPAHAAALKAVIDRVFRSGGTLIYTGYVDDHRNTDNAWMETSVVNFHDPDGQTFGQLPLRAGDDAGDVAWVPAEPGMQLYASHALFIDQVCQMRARAWKPSP